MKIHITSTEGLKSYTEAAAIGEYKGEDDCYEITFDNPKKENVLIPRGKVLLIQIANE